MSLACALFAVAGGLSTAHADNAPSGRYAAWSRGPSSEETFFPIAVWLQNPAKAARYKVAGINTYIGLWKGPTESQLAQLRHVGMKVICAQNEVARQHLDDPTIIGWMHGDEPDNAQPLAEGGYGPPIPPERIVGDYHVIRKADPTRPVLLNLGQGVAYDNWIGRGVRRNRPEDYPLYIEGCDIVSFDIYPVVHRNPEVAGKLWYVAKGVERLVSWSQGRKIVWNCIECTRIQHPTAKPTPRQVRAEVWMSLIHGSCGLIYFVHEWQPRFNESALLDDVEMLGAVTRINARIHALAPVLNAPTQSDAVTVVSSDPDVPIASLVKSYRGDVYSLRGRDAPRHDRGALLIAAGGQGGPRGGYRGGPRGAPGRRGIHGHLRRLAGAAVSGGHGRALAISSAATPAMAPPSGNPAVLRYTVVIGGL